MAHGRPVLIWAAAWFFLGQFALIAWLEATQPGFFDPKYGCRLRQLRARLQEELDAELFVVLGSSRAEQGLRPASLDLASPRCSPLLFNFARGGSSPLLHLLTLRRLLADGIHPRGILLEIFPPSLVEEPAGVTLVKTTWRDFRWLSPYAVSGKTYAYHLRDRLLFWSRYRSRLLASFAADWLAPEASWAEQLWDPRGGEWRSIGAGVPSEERQALTADAQRRYFHQLQHFTVAAPADEALRAILDLCRRERIEVVLFLMPEASVFRSWYPATAQRVLSTYMQALQHAHGVASIDARTWIPDEEFCDGHHLLRGGAQRFTQRFGDLLFSHCLRE